MNLIEKHTLQIGKLLVNLHGLEFTLRLFLANLEGQKTSLPKVGETSAVLSRITDYSSLGELIDDFNKTASTIDPKYVLDKRIVLLRDSLAHGRVFTKQVGDTFQKIKFGKPKKKDSTVIIEYNEDATEEWFKENTENLYSQIKKVVELGQKTGLHVNEEIGEASQR